MTGHIDADVNFKNYLWAFDLGFDYVMAEWLGFDQLKEENVAHAATYYSARPECIAGGFTDYDHIDADPEKWGSLTNADYLLYGRNYSHDFVKTKQSAAASGQPVYTIYVASAMIVCVTSWL